MAIELRFRSLKLVSKERMSMAGKEMVFTKPSERLEQSIIVLMLSLCNFVLLILS